MKRAAVLAGCCPTRLSNMFVCLFNFVNSLSLSGLLLLFFAFLLLVVLVLSFPVFLFNLFSNVFSRFFKSKLKHGGLFFIGYFVKIVSH